MSDKFRLDGSPYPDGDVGLLEWARDLADTKGRILKQEYLWNGLWVSTVWLGLDHSFGFGPPLIFETMVFDRLNDGSSADLDMDRYSTLEDAELGHLWTVQEYSRIWPTLKRWFLEAWRETDAY